MPGSVHLIAFGWLFLAMFWVQSALAEDNPGEEQFKKACGVCRTLEPNAPVRQGPNLHGVYGRSSGQLAGFKYSDALGGIEG